MSDVLSLSQCHDDLSDAQELMRKVAGLLNQYIYSDSPLPKEWKIMVQAAEHSVRVADDLITGVLWKK